MDPNYQRCQGYAPNLPRESEAQGHRLWQFKVAVIPQLNLQLAPLFSLQLALQLSLQLVPKLSLQLVLQLACFLPIAAGLDHLTNRSNCSTSKV